MAAEQLTISHAGRVLVIPGQPVLEEQSILVSAGKIVGMVPGYVSVADPDTGYSQVEFLDLKDHFVLPGLMDLHVHITMEPRPQEHLRVVTETDADLALTASYHAKITLDAGFTTIVDLGRPERLCSVLPNLCCLKQSPIR